MTNEPSPKRRRIVKQYALRIDQIPFDKTYESLCDELKSFLVGELEPGDDVNFVLHFLCRRDENFSCATATFHAPISAGELAKELNSACIPRSYHFDADFQGITPLYESPKGADVEYVYLGLADNPVEVLMAWLYGSVIAVPGLASHAIGSWKSRNGQDVWLRDYLPHDIDGIRVLIYGYNTSLLGSASKDSIVDLGKGFLESVKAFRKDTNVCPCRQSHNYLSSQGTDRSPPYCIHRSQPWWPADQRGNRSYTSKRAMADPRLAGRLSSKRTIEVMTRRTIIFEELAMGYFSSAFPTLDYGMSSYKASSMVNQTNCLYESWLLTMIRSLVSF